MKKAKSSKCVWVNKVECPLCNRRMLCLQGLYDHQRNGECAYVAVVPQTSSSSSAAAGASAAAAVPMIVAGGERMIFLDWIERSCVESLDLNLYTSILHHKRMQRSVGEVVGMFLGSLMFRIPVHQRPILWQWEKDTGDCRYRDRNCRRRRKIVWLSMLSAEWRIEHEQDWKTACTDDAVADVEDKKYDDDDDDNGGDDDDSTGGGGGSLLHAAIKGFFRDMYRESTRVLRDEPSFSGYMYTLREIIDMEDTPMQHARAIATFLTAITL